MIIRALSLTALLKAPASVPLSPDDSPSTPTSDDPVFDSAKATLSDLAVAIQTTTNPVRLEELLGANDELTAAINYAAAGVGGDRKEKERSLSVGGSLLDSEGSNNPGEEVPAQAPSGNGNGQIAHETEVEEEPEEEPPTPRVDKGKGKASPEELETILDPTFMIESEEEDDDEQEVDEVAKASPTDR